MEAHAVSRVVNGVMNDTEECIKPIDDETTKTAAHKCIKPIDDETTKTAAHK